MKWKTVKIGDVCQIVSGTTPSTNVAEYWRGEFNWIAPAEIEEDSKFIFNTQKKITQRAVNETSIRLLPVGTVLLSSRAPIGKVAIAATEMYCNQGFKNLICSDEVHNEFLFWFLKGKKDFLNSLGRGATFKEISKSIVALVEIPLPPLAEQRRIAAILDKADAIRRKRQQSLELADSLLKSVFLDMFGDPVTNEKKFPIRALPEFYCNTREGTKCGPFGSALKKDEFTTQGVPVWCMDNISLDGNTALPFRLWISEEKYQQLLSYSVLKGDIIISRAGTVGKMCVATDSSDKAIISTNLIRLRLNSELCPRFFVSLITYCKGRVGRLKVGNDGAFTHMSTGVLDSLAFPYPPKPLQNKFAVIVQKVEAHKQRAMQGQQEADDLFKALQQQLFS